MDLSYWTVFQLTLIVSLDYFLFPLEQYSDQKLIAYARLLKLVYRNIEIWVDSFRLESDLHHQNI